MLNTGNLLRRPGESKYSRYRRFLIANHGAYGSAQRIRKALLRYAVSRSHSVHSGIHNFKLIELLESKEPYTDQVYLESRFVYPRAHKNCPICSEVGYHSEVFNYDWVSICPIHKIKLVKRCHVCSEIWPSCSKILLRDCLGCGAKINFTKLMSSKAFSNVKRFNALEYLNEFANPVNEPVEYSLDIKSEFSGEFHQYRRTNSPSLFTPTAIAIRHSNSNRVLSRLSDLGVRTFKTIEISFDIDIKSEGCDRLSTSEREKIKSKVLDAIQNNFEHKLGGCTNDDWRMKDACSMCLAFLMFIELNDFDYGYPYNQHTFRIAENEVTRVKNLPRPYGARVPQRISINRFVNSHKAHHKKINIPISVQAQLYEFELYLSFSHALMLIDHIKKCYEIPNCTQLDAYSAAPKTIRQYGLVTQPYYVHTSQEEAFITLPQIVVRPEELLGHELFYGASNYCQQN